MWLYAGAVADAISAAKARGRLPNLGAIARPWLQLANTAGALQLCAVAPQMQRLAARGWHLPDELARLGGQSVRVLHRQDLLAPRRQERKEAPQFRALGPAGPVPVWLVDDVVTSGQTLDCAAAALRAAGWQVAGALVLADARPAVLAAWLEAEFTGRQRPAPQQRRHLPT